VSQTITVSTIQSRVCTLCGIEDTLTADTNPSSTAMLDLLKTACSELAAIVGERASEMYFATTGTVSTVASTATVALPANFSDLLRITWQRSESEEIELHRATPETARAWPNAWNSDECAAVFYTIEGSNLRFFPTPDAVYTVNLRYTTGLYPASTAATFTGRDGWDQWIALYTCVLVRARQQRSAQDFMTLLYGPDLETGGLTARIRRQLRRDRVGVRRVRDRRAPFIRGQRDPWPAD
jgi:hypothetical protein